MPISLPKPIASYFAAEKAEDASALARCFTGEGVVRDEGGRFVVPLSATDSDGVIVVLARVAGDFPGSPLELTHIFKLDGEEIASLEIR